MEAGRSGSRQTNTGGRGIYEAGIDAKQQILKMAAQKFVDDAKRKNEQLQVTPEQLDIKNGDIFVKATPSKKLTIEAVVIQSA